MFKLSVFRKQNWLVHILGKYLSESKFRDKNVENNNLINKKNEKQSNKPSKSTLVLYSWTWEK